MDRENVANKFEVRSLPVPETACVIAIEVLGVVANLRTANLGEEEAVFGWYRSKEHW